MFRVVLNYLRSQCTQPICFEENQRSRLFALHAEATFYGVEPLINVLDEILQDFQAREQQSVQTAIPDKALGTKHINIAPSTTAQVAAAAAPPVQGPPDASPTAQVNGNDVGVDAEAPPAVAGYQEHAELIRLAASNMDFDF